MTKLQLRPEWFDPTDGTHKCVVCKSPKYNPAYETERFGYPLRFLRCECGTYKQVPMPTKEFMGWFFNSDLFVRSGAEIWGYDDYLRDEQQREKTSRLRFKRLSALLSPGPVRLLKIGPSTGTFLRLAKDAGHDVRGVDVSAQFARLAHERHGLQVDVGRFEEQDYPSAHFDLVFLFNVIENVPNLDAFMQEVNRVLRVGGHFIVNFVDMKHNVISRLQGSNYFLVRPPICYMFCRDAFRVLLANYGFSVTRTIRDWRYLSANKVTGLLRWWFVRKAVRSFGNWEFPVYAYPSRVLVCRKNG